MQRWCSVGYLLLDLQQNPPGSFRDDDTLSLSTEHGKDVLVRDGDGAKLHEGHDPLDTPGRRPLTPLLAIRKLVNKRQVHAAYKIDRLDSVVAQVRIDIHLHTSLWEGYTWNTDNAAALVFARLRPLSHNVSQPSAGLERLSPEHYSIASCFSELLLPVSDLPLPESRHTGGSLLGLSVDVLSKVLRHLEVQDVCSFSMTSKLCKALCQEATPGLNLSLYPHQRTARRWMLDREAAKGPIEQPTWKKFKTAEGLPIYLCGATGDVTIEEPSALSDIRGGLFCDEPGLGKTITALSLVLSTKGIRPAALPGKQVTTLPDARGRQASFYMMDSGSKREAQGSASGVSRRSERGLRPVNRYSPDEKGTPEVPKIMPGRAMRSNSSSAVRHPSAREVAQETESKAAEGSPLVDGLQSPVTQPLNQKRHCDSEDDGPLRKKQKLEDSSCGDESSKTTWVQCDACQKWRSLQQEPGEQTWMCTMHPDPAFRSCKVPQEKIPTSDQYTECHGYVDSAEEMGKAENVEYFGDLVTRHLRSLDCRQRVLRWLGKLKHKELLEGVIKVPVAKLGITHADHVPSLLAELELSPLTADGKKAAAAMASTWQQGNVLAVLYLDTMAASKAADLCKTEVSGPKSEQMRVYLSPATLLVVPATLIGHWQEQIEMHTAQGALRVRILNKVDGQESTAMNIAWHYDLVVTTFSRLSTEWGKEKKKQRSIFDQVHWLRVILDEGHMLGTSLNLTNKLSMAKHLKTERRWIMTGTPTPSTPTSHVAHLHPLLSFLGQQPYGTQKSFWEVAVQKPFEAQLPEGRERLMQLLSHLAIRASKNDLEIMVRRTHKVTRLYFAPEHAMSYNELVALIKNNILTSDWGDEDHMESILSDNKSKWNSQMFLNIRLSCCVAGIVNVAVVEKDLKETLEFLAERHMHETVDAEYPPWLPETHPLAGVEASMRYGCKCEVCDSFARIPLVTPCAHLVCSDCAAPHRTQCPLCKKPYLMQAVNDPKRKHDNTNPKWAVPLEFIEWQPSYTQQGAEGISGGQWSVSWEITKSSKILYLLKKLNKIGAVPKKAPPQSPQPNNSIWDIPEAKPDDKEPLTKAIVFSQLWTHIQLTGTQLRGQGVSVVLFTSNLKPQERAANLQKFKEDDQCSVLLMDEAGSVGLDLSFVSWVFLMEPLENGSLEEQVISRAHRMGAKAAVQVETLVMRGTVEEKVLELRALQRRPAAEQGSVDATAMDISPGALRVVAQQGTKKGSNNIREQHNAMLRSLLCIKVADLRDVQDL